MREERLKRTLTAITVGLLLAVPITQAKGIAPPTVLTIFANASTGGCYLYPTGTVTKPLGGEVLLSNNDSVSRTVESVGFWSKTVAPGDQRSVILHASGTYPETCDGDSTDPLAAKIKAPGHPSTASFKVTWADSGAKSTWRFNIQYRIGSHHYVDWKLHTSAHSDTFRGTNGKVYHFRARVLDPDAGTATDWSPSKRVTT